MPSTIKRAGSPAGGLLLFLRVCIALAVAMISVPLLLASPSSAAPGDKVVVCKYVSTPGGVVSHVVVVAEDTLPDEWDGSSFPFEWTDAHGQTEIGSIAIRFALPGPPPEQASTISLGECPGEVPPDECVDLPGNQPPGFQCTPESETETQDLGPLLDCDAGTITTLHQERTRTQTFDAETQEWVWGAFSDWETVDTTEVDATEVDCPVDPPVEPVVDPPVETPTLPNTGVSPYLTALGLMGALILAAGSTLFMRFRKVRVPKA
jgi:LPXTG-motif cell wall-anchored protein